MRIWLVQSHIFIICLFRSAGRYAVSCRLIGIAAIIISVYFLIGGLYLPQAGISPAITLTSLMGGIILLITGIVFYKILRSDED